LTVIEMMQQAIQNHADNHRIAEDLTPGAETLIAGNDD
jgi:hypothetical protein